MSTCWCTFVTTVPALIRNYKLEIGGRQRITNIRQTAVLCDSNDTTVQTYVFIYLLHVLYPPLPPPQRPARYCAVPGDNPPRNRQSLSGSVSWPNSNPGLLDNSNDIQVCHIYKHIYVDTKGLPAFSINVFDENYFSMFFS